MSGPESLIRPDEIVVFFPTYGVRDADGGFWNVAIHGWIYEPRESPLKRSVALAFLRRAMRLDLEENEATLMKQRLRAFVVNNRRGRAVSIRVGDAVYQLPKSKPDGHFRDVLSVPDSVVHQVMGGPVHDSDWLPFAAATGEGDERNFAGHAYLMHETGVSVVSDIDDTIKISDVLHRRELLANTFLRKFRAVPEMAAMYRHWAEAGACIHYVSSSPWQLYEPLDELLRDAGFPAGTMHLRRFRLKQVRRFRSSAVAAAEKRQEIEDIVGAFPRRTFVFVGDSGERDPEIYGDLAREFPDRIERIYIRNVTGDSSDSDRFAHAFAGVEPERWRLFVDPSEIPVEEDTVWG